ncbi:MAG: hypothetical protein WCI88_06580 [Chloroflexota bacterium]
MRKHPRNIFFHRIMGLIFLAFSLSQTVSVSALSPNQNRATLTGYDSERYANHPGAAFNLADPTLLSPAGIVSTPRPAFKWYVTGSTIKWTAVSSSTKFQLLIKKGASIVHQQWYTAIQAQCYIGKGYCALASPLALSDGSYTWQIRKRNTSGIGAWSSSKSFTILLMPEKTSLLTPTCMTIKTRPTFRWNAIKNTTQYQILARDGTSTRFQNQVTSQQAHCSSGTGECWIASPLVLSDLTSYSWSVRGWNQYGYGNWSSTAFFHVSTADNDGDALPDAWETCGYDSNDDGHIDVNLPALGADPRHKDIFVYMNFMVSPSVGDLGPTSQILNRITSVFSNAPVTNPDGIDGIDIHLELGNQVPYQETLGYYNPDWNIMQNSIWTDFDAIKAMYFPAARSATHHYMIWANSYGGTTSSGLARGIPTNDFIVSLGYWGSGGTEWERQGTFIHELGHTIGLTHGGGGINDHVNYKPNYLSVMSYTFQVNGLYRGGCWGDAGCPDNFDYQRFTLPALNESNLNETLGLNGGVAITGYKTCFFAPDYSQHCDPVDTSLDWNNNHIIDVSVSVDINDDGDITTLLATQNNWENLIFDGGGIIGSGLPYAELQRFVANMPSIYIKELDLEMLQKMKESSTISQP